MARPLRIEMAGGRYHVTARGNERRRIFRDERDYEHLVELLGELPERFGTVLHAYVLMPNHFHVVLETPEANLSRTGQWLNVSYSVWFNRRHERSGHLFQGRFGAILIEDEAGLQEVGRYVHLNPVRVKELGLDRQRRQAGRLGLAAPASAEVVARRLSRLKSWKWSSYPAYAGYVKAPPWLSCEVLGGLCGGRSRKEGQAAVRRYTEQAIREGMPEQPWERLIGGVVLGTEAFAERLLGKVKGDLREQPMLRQMVQRVSWEQIVMELERVKGQRWEEFCDRYGDWGRDSALWLGRRVGRMRLRELGERAGGMDYNAVSAAMKRFGRRLAKDRTLKQLMDRLGATLSNLEM
jgi:putative transposase